MTEQDLPENLQRNFGALALRGGAFIGPVIADMKFDAESVSKATSGWTIQFGAKEKVGDHDAQAIVLQKSAGEKGSYSMTLWVDANSLVPLKSTVVSKLIGPGGNATYAETWEEVEVGREIDDKTFELPK